MIRVNFTRDGSLAISKRRSSVQWRQKKKKKKKKKTENDNVSTHMLKQNRARSTCNWCISKTARRQVVWCKKYILTISPLAEGRTRANVFHTRHFPLRRYIRNANRSCKNSVGKSAFGTLCVPNNVPVIARMLIRLSVKVTWLPEAGLRLQRHVWLL